VNVDSETRWLSCQRRTRSARATIRLWHGPVRSLSDDQSGQVVRYCVMPVSRCAGRMKVTNPLLKVWAHSNSLTTAAFREGPAPVRLLPQRRHSHGKGRSHANPPSLGVRRSGRRLGGVLCRCFTHTRNGCEHPDSMLRRKHGTSA